MQCCTVEGKRGDMFKRENILIYGYTAICPIADTTYGQKIVLMLSVLSLCYNNSSNKEEKRKKYILYRRGYRQPPIDLSPDAP